MAARQSLRIPAFRTPVDCTPWVLDDLWPAELATVTAETATLAHYLNADLQRIVNSANEKLYAIGRAGLVGPARQAEEARLIGIARAFAVHRVESTVRQLRNESPEFPTEYLSPTPPRQDPDTTEQPLVDPDEHNLAAQFAEQTSEAADEEPESDEQRLRRLLKFVARQEPGLRWAIGAGPDGSTVLVTDIAHGWIPSGIELPAGVQLLEPGWRDGNAAALLGPTTTLSATYAPGDRLGWATGFDSPEPSLRPRELPVVEDLGAKLTEATHWRDGLAGMVNTLAKAGASGTGVAGAEIDVLRVQLDTARYQLLAQYPEVDTALLLNCMLLAATEAIATGDKVSANYHFAWFQTVSAPPASSWAVRS
jgi:hypothetical protein